MQLSEKRNGETLARRETGVNYFSIPRSRSQVELCDFCVRRGDFFSIGSEGWTQVSFERQRCCRHHMLTTPCSISGDRPSLTLFAHILLQVVFLPLHVGWDTALFAGNYPMFTSSP